MAASDRDLQDQLEALPYRVMAAPVGPFMMNMSTLMDPPSGQAVLVDVGEDPTSWLALHEESGCELTEVWQTHAHIDHVWGLPILAAMGGPAPRLNPMEKPVYQAQEYYAKAAYGIELPGSLPEPTLDLDDGVQLNLGTHIFEVMHTPGHAPGHVIFIDHANKFVIGGDLLFRGSVGRTDLPGCDPRSMRSSLHKILDLDDETLVLPGHGPMTTIGRERRTNPFLLQLG